MGRGADIDRFKEIREAGVVAVARALGLAIKNRQLTPCPACGADRRGGEDKRYPIGIKPEGLGWRCQRCKEGGDAVTLAAWRILGRGKTRGGDDALKLLGACADLGLCTPVDPHQPRVTPKLPPLPPPPPPVRLAADDVAALWASCVDVTTDADVSAWLEHRWLNAEDVAERDLARALPVDATLPSWARYRGRPWTETTHRLVVPLFDAEGRLVSVHARALAAADPKGRDKAAFPVGAEVRGLVMADGIARALLAGDATVRDLVIVEGVPDFLTWGVRHAADGESPLAVVGITAGAWTSDIASRIPSGSRVAVRTHTDEAGDKYADAITSSLTGRCSLHRLRKAADHEG